ncbi:hypothetical protein [Streptomyces syringium]|uniref:hypothetical protein n=1 Tax=Streptomyces syringium TaxID=76729 RepID=UPI0034556C34
MITGITGRAESPSSGPPVIEKLRTGSDTPGFVFNENSTELLPLPVGSQSNVPVPVRVRINEQGFRPPLLVAVPLAVSLPDLMAVNFPFGDSQFVSLPVISTLAVVLELLKASSKFASALAVQVKSPPARDGADATAAFAVEDAKDAASRATGAASRRMDLSM